MTKDNSLGIVFSFIQMSEADCTLMRFSDPCLFMKTEDEAPALANDISHGPRCKCLS